LILNYFIGICYFFFAKKFDLGFHYDTSVLLLLMKESFFYTDLNVERYVDDRIETVLLRSFLKVKGF